jgi:hypothetical protein
MNYKLDENEIYDIREVSFMDGKINMIKFETNKHIMIIGPFRDQIIVLNKLSKTSDWEIWDYDRLYDEYKVIMECVYISNSGKSWKNKIYIPFDIIRGDVKPFEDIRRLDDGNIIRLDFDKMYVLYDYQNYKLYIFKSYKFEEYEKIIIRYKDHRNMIRNKVIINNKFIRPNVILYDTFKNCKYYPINSYKMYKDDSIFLNELRINLRYNEEYLDKIVKYLEIYYEIKEVRESENDKGIYWITLDNISRYDITKELLIDMIIRDEENKEES